MFQSIDIVYLEYSYVLVINFIYKGCMSINLFKILFSTSDLFHNSFKVQWV